MKRFFRYLLIVLLVLLLLGGGLFYFFPGTVRSFVLPAVDHIDNLRVSLRKDTAYLDVAVQMRNKSIFRMNLDSIIYDIRFDTARIAQRSQDLSVRLDPGEVDTFHLPGKLSLKVLQDEILAAQKNDSATISADLRLVYSTVFGNTSFSKHIRQRIAVPRPPSVDVAGVKYLGRKGRKFQFLVKVRMRNPGSLEVTVSKLRYEVKIGDKIEADGELGKKVEISPRSVSMHEIPVETEFSDLLRTLSAIISDKDNIPYSARLRGQIHTREEEIIPFDVIKKGQVDLKK